MAFNPHDVLVIVHIASRHVAATVAIRRGDQAERVEAHKVVYCQWNLMNRRGRVQALAEAISEACASAGVQVYSVYVAIADSDLRAEPSEGHVELGEPITISRTEIELAKSRALQQAIGLEREVIHALPRQFTVRTPNQGTQVLSDPQGQRGSGLKCELLLVSYPKKVRQEIAELLEECEVEFEGLIAPPVALYRGMHSSLGKRGTQIIIDHGARHTHIIVHRQHLLEYMETFDFGGDHLSELLAAELNVDVKRAEEVKHQIDISKQKQNDPEVDGQTYLWQNVQEQDRLMGPASFHLNTVLRSFFGDASTMLEERGVLGHDKSRNRIFLVGRASRLRGLPQLVQEIFQMQVVLGTGRKEREANAEVADLITLGLVRTAAKERERLLHARDASGIMQVRRFVSGLGYWLLQPVE